MKDKTWLMPEYYPEFRCKADRCRSTCCSRWRIPVSRKEYLRLVTLDCSEELDRRIQKTFVIPEQVTEDCYRYISFNWEGVCPIQEKGLCSLYSEVGEEVLPRVCRLFPRSLKDINGHLLACCSSSCERVVEMLYEADSLRFITKEMDTEAQASYEVSEEDIEQISQFQLIIKDRSTTLAQSIEEVCRIINAEEFERDFEADVDPLQEGLKLIEHFTEGNDPLADLCLEVIDRYEKDPGEYKKDREVFEERFPDWMFFFEKVMNNSMIYENYPFVDKRADRTGTYRGLCLCYGLLRLLCIGHTADHPKTEDLIDTVASLFRLIDHTAFYYNASIINDNAAVFLKL